MSHGTRETKTNAIINFDLFVYNVADALLLLFFNTDIDISVLPVFVARHFGYVKG